jgi:threonine dehydrogenase-like Zn-dependent dehydrogenase
MRPKAGEVLCRTLELGVCGTDREILLSAKPWTPPGEERLILGHECLAKVDAVGPGVSNFLPGDLVVPAVRRALSGHKRRADLLPFGTYTERGIVREHGFSQPLWLDRPEFLFRVPPEIADLAVLAEPLAVSEKGVNEALLLTRARLGETAWTPDNPPKALVTGMGPIAFTAALACIARGWPVTLLGRDEPSTFRATLAKDLGAQYERLVTTEKSPSDVENEGFDLLLECTGSDAMMASASRWVRSCGVVVWLGSNRVPQSTTCDLQRLVRDGLLRNHIFLGCVNEAPRDFQDALAHLERLSQDRRPQLTALITARVRLENSLWHYEHRQPQGIKTVVMYS